MAAAGTVPGREAGSGTRPSGPGRTASGRTAWSVRLTPAPRRPRPRYAGTVAGPWSPGSGLQATAHDARRTLDFALTWMEPRTRGLIPYDADTTLDARCPATGNTGSAAAELMELAAAADQLRAGRCNQVEAHRTVYRIARSRRLLRWGPDGPEGPRPSDTSTHAPTALHPRLDEDGAVHFDEPAGDEPAS
ncbi:DUF5954 family protein [Streptomyces sp. NPDC056269]|uniref:DUF5954 family protein n=1 Tax=Streptomyces sp. NPDC056269 TaxID=3345768 RepID=UPI0035D82C65